VNLKGAKAVVKGNKKTRKVIDPKETNQVPEKKARMTEKDEESPTTTISKGPKKKAVIYVRAS
jgi:hypothetical protein